MQKMQVNIEKVGFAILPGHHDVVLPDFFGESTRALHRCGYSACRSSIVPCHFSSCFDMAGFPPIIDI